MSRGFTLVEMLVILGILVVLAAVLVPIVDANRGVSSKRVNCAQHLKQVGYAFLLWGLDHDGKTPPQVGTNAGGSSEFIASGQTFRHFQTLSNELLTPKVLVCPADVRKAAPGFGAGFSNSNLSYFVNVDTASTNVHNFLSGDHNITNGPLSPARIMELTSNSVVGWNHKLHVLQGNICLRDGSVQQIANFRLRRSLSWNGTNRVAMP